MKIEDLVLTIDQAKHLQRLGIDMSDASLCWFRGTRNRYGNHCEGIWEVRINPFMVGLLEEYEIIPTYTLQEILDKIPRIFDINRYIDSDEISFLGCTDKKGRPFYHSIVTDKGLLDCAYKMLCWLIRNGYLKTN